MFNAKYLSHKAVAATHLRRRAPQCTLAATAAVAAAAAAPAAALVQTKQNINDSNCEFIYLWRLTKTKYANF